MAYQIAAYLRLSVADADIDKAEKDESNSIQNQRKLIRHYLNTSPEFTTGQNQDYDYHEYVDDGISGTTTRFRPSFLHMIQDTERHRINCIIVKDFSRFSREALVLGDYIEQIFPMKGIRFISINDRYDSQMGNSSASASLLSVSMQALINEYYVKDISRKKKSATRSRLSQGATYGCAPYGYRKTGYRTFEINPETSLAVLRIYDLALAGNSLSNICRIMTAEHYPTPNAYGLLHPEESHFRRDTPISTSFWSQDTIRKILHNPAYIGTLITGKTSTVGPNSHNNVKTEPDSWFVTENVYPPIISREVFALVQERYPLNTRKEARTSVDSKNPKCNLLYPKRTILVGHLKCGYCGKSMIIDRYGSKCRCHNARYNIPELCSAIPHAISDIELALLPLIQKRSKQILLQEEKMQEEYRLKKHELKNLSYQKALLEKDLDKLLTQKQCTYESFTISEISVTQFQMLVQSLRIQIENKRHALTVLENHMEQCNTFTRSTDLERIAETIANYPSAEQLTDEMVDVFIHYIVLKNDEPYDIHWKYDEKGCPLDESQN